MHLLKFYLSLLMAIVVLQFTSISGLTTFDYQISTNASLPDGSSVSNGINLYPVSGTSGTPVASLSSGSWTNGVGKNLAFRYTSSSNSLGISFDGGVTWQVKSGFVDGPANTLVVSLQTNSDPSITANTSLSLSQMTLAYGTTTYSGSLLTISGQNAANSFTFPASITGDWQLNTKMTMSWIGTAPAHNAAQFNIASLPLLAAPEPSTYLILGSFLVLIAYVIPLRLKKREHITNQNKIG